MNEAVWIVLGIAICSYLGLGIWLAIRRMQAPIPVLASSAPIPAACSGCPLLQPNIMAMSSAQLNHQTEDERLEPDRAGQPDGGEEPENEGRRRFLTRIIFAIGGVIALVIALPVLTYILAPVLQMSSGDSGKTAELGPVSDFPQDKMVQKTFKAKVDEGWIKGKEVDGTVYVRNLGNNQFLALSATCTHLGCTVNWKPDQNEFVCPCHGGRYTPQGINIPGTPPPKPLARYNAKVTGGKVVIDL